MLFLKKIKLRCFIFKKWSLIICFNYCLTYASLEEYLLPIHHFQRLLCRSSLVHWFIWFILVRPNTWFIQFILIPEISLINSSIIFNINIELWGSIKWCHLQIPKVHLKRVVFMKGEVREWPRWPFNSELRFSTGRMVFSRKFVSFNSIYIFLFYSHYTISTLYQIIFSFFIKY